jgi:predicted CopG family antitoxin
MSADKKIRVSEDSRKQLHDLKEPGDSYDDVIQELVWEHNQAELAERMRETDEMDSDEFVPLRDERDE